LNATYKSKLAHSHQGMHRRLRYEPRHVHRLGLISRPIPDHPIRELRNTHRICVSLEAGLLDEFGAEVGDHVHG